MRRFHSSVSSLSLSSLALLLYSRVLWYACACAFFIFTGGTQAAYSCTRHPHMNSSMHSFCFLSLYKWCTEGHAHTQHSHTHSPAHQKPVGSGISTPCRIFCLICTISSELDRQMDLFHTHTGISVFILYGTLQLVGSIEL